MEQRGPERVRRRRATSPGEWNSGGRRAIALGAVAAALACAGPYGHSRSYAPLGPERAAAEGATPYDALMAQRQPDVWQKKTVDVFGIVLSAQPLEGGGQDLLVSARQLRPRNLCEDSSEESCRVTVSDHESATLHVRIEPSDAPAEVAKTLESGYLVRAIGRLDAQSAGSDGTDVLDAAFYRAWPPGEYVTDAARAYMRR